MISFLADTTYSRDPLRVAITRQYRADETIIVKSLQETMQLSAQQQQRITQHAIKLVKIIRKSRLTRGGLDAFMHEYDLSNKEGVLLMCLAESLMRIPDECTTKKLIADKIGGANWEKHLGKSHSVFTNASTWALMLTGKIIQPEIDDNKPLSHILESLSKKIGEPLVRKSVNQGMRIIARQFVLGSSIKKAIQRASPWQQNGYTFSYDMLGEEAHTTEDAKRYFHAYQDAILQLGSRFDGQKKEHHTDNIQKLPGVSIKLSALHQRYEYSQRERILKELLPILKVLAELAKQNNILLTIDAEEADRLELSFDLLEALLDDTTLKNWNGLGIALQAYQKRAFPAIEWLQQLSTMHNIPLHIRLVKGAYWDSEIKRAQQLGLNAYPVFTRKVNTDISYLACAKRLLATSPLIYPQFATHNAQTVATILEFSNQKPSNKKFEFQRLQGMGESLFDALINNKITKKPINCRIYAPVGKHHNLLPYLVRRLLENGANTSFINRVQDDQLAVEKIVQDPLQFVKKLPSIPHPDIPLPGDLFQPDRINSKGLDLSDTSRLYKLKRDIQGVFQTPYFATSLFYETPRYTEIIEATNPANKKDVVGSFANSNKKDVINALKNSAIASAKWDKLATESRATLLQKIADLYEKNHLELIALLVRESGKTIVDALSEVREAVDFCRYYAHQCLQNLQSPIELRGTTGEINTLRWHARGVFACISPWNFPLAIFTGQITAALVTGNTVIAKPASQSPLISHFACELMYQAGIPRDVLQLVIGKGSTIGTTLVTHDSLAGVAFTGGFKTAQQIQHNLANRKRAILPFIAETGGINAMIVDSSALTEQVVTDVIQSAFSSAGQRCSALRILYLQNDIADKTITMLVGAMKELSIGDPCLLKTDIGPVITQNSKSELEEYIKRYKGQLVYQTQLPESCNHGSFVAPCIIQVDNIKQLGGEKFGPILHICRYPTESLEQVVNDINKSGYGLTLGIHSRINKVIDYLTTHLKIGNTYVNRNQIGAVVGSQPFGGEGLSGTGPKAGGPHYLQRFMTERVVTINTTAQGGDISLLSLDV